MLPFSSSWSAGAAGTTAGATVTQAATGSGLMVCRHISGHSDTDTIIRIRDTDDNILFETKLVTGQNGNGFSIAIPDGVHSNSSLGIKGEVVSSTSDCYVTISGYYIG